MKTKAPDIGILTDEVSLDLTEAFELCHTWGITRFELREGTEQRFPFFTTDDISRVDAAIRAGARITAVSPGLFKGAADDDIRVNRELDEVLPRSLELADRFGCPVLIVFGFERHEGEHPSSRSRAQQALARVAEAASDAGMVVAVENEPNFWIDTPAETIDLLDEIAHPLLRINWDPANLVWGGYTPTYDDFTALKPFITNVHVKDYAPGNPEQPWPPVGQGEMAWPEMLRWIAEDTDLTHVTLETHCLPRIESSKQSLDALREILKREW